MLPLRGSTQRFRLDKALVFKPEVEKDLFDGYRWYEDKSRGLGEDFLIGVNDEILEKFRQYFKYSVDLDEQNKNWI